MAKRLSSQTAALVDAKHRKSALQAALAEMYELDTEMENLAVLHFKDLKDRRSEILKDLREKYNITASVVRARYYPYRMERRAKEGEDDVTLDTLRELFEILPVGGQGNFLNALDDDDGDKKTAAPKKPEVARGAKSGSKTKAKAAASTSTSHTTVAAKAAPPPLPTEPKPLDIGGIPGRLQ